MFIPKGKAIHENLATSYVLVDALVADLCEGGFSGVVEIVLRQITGYIIFDGGSVAAVTEKRGAADYVKTSLAELSATSRSERGRLAVYSYAEPIAKALSSLLHAEPLYTRLSSEFADLQKMVIKFMREGDRHWFIEVQTDNSTSLVFINDSNCVVVTPTLISSDGSPEKLETINRLALQELIDRCNRSGAIFDVYFRNPNDTVEIEVAQERASQSVAPTPEAPPATSLSIDQLQMMAATEEGELVKSKAASLTPSDVESTSQTSPVSAVKVNGEWPLVLVPPITTPVVAPVAIESDSDIRSLLADKVITNFPQSLPDEDNAAIVEPEDVQARPPVTAAVSTDFEHHQKVLPTRELMAMAGTDESLLEDFKMTEVKRLLSDIVRSIEEITRIVEQRDDFSMHLRAGQLKVANQYPFLDPFGSDFEYIEGEIVFVGKARLDEFIGGVSEALRFAVTNAVQVSINPPRLQAEIIRKLKFLYERNRDEFNQHGLDLSIEQITGAQMAS